MTFKNITENAVINACGRLVDPGVEIQMKTSYYSENKGFIDNYVDEKKAKIGGMKEYLDLVGKVSDEKETEAEVEKVDLVAEVETEAKAEADAKAETEAKAEAKKDTEPAQKRRTRQSTADKK